jgi:hypothetical protein
MLAAWGTVTGAQWTAKTKETRTAIFERNTIAELKSRRARIRVKVHGILGVDIAVKVVLSCCANRKDSG